MYYKVVYKDRDDGTLYSCSTVRTGLKLVYKQNEWTKPKIPNSKIFVFDSLIAARDFSRYAFTFEIWECEVKNPVKALSMCVWYVENDFDNFWNNKPTEFNNSIPPEHTVYADEVMLTKKVEKCTIK